MIRNQSKRITRDYLIVQLMGVFVIHQLLNEESRLRIATNEDTNLRRLIASAADPFGNLFTERIDRCFLDLIAPARSILYRKKCYLNRALVRSICLQLLGEFLIAAFVCFDQHLIIPCGSPPFLTFLIQRFKYLLIQYILHQLWNTAEEVIIQLNDIRKAAVIGQQRTLIDKLWSRLFVQVERVGNLLLDLL